MIRDFYKTMGVKLHGKDWKILSKGLKYLNI